MYPTYYNDDNYNNHTGYNVTASLILLTLKGKMIQLTFTLFTKAIKDINNFLIGVKSGGG